MKLTRTHFLRLLGFSAAGSLISFTGATKDPDPVFNPALGLASYTLRNFKLEDVIKMTLRAGLKNIVLKSMHMPLESSPDQLKQIAAQVRAAGLNLYGAGVIYIKTPEEADNVFAYATHAGLKMIVGVPNYELLPQINDLVKKTNIQVAIHNHGPEDKLYPSPADVYEKIKDLDKRIGMCIDIGHVKRLGLDPAVMLERYKDRLYEMHMKDVDKVAADGQPIEIGHGVINIVSVVNTLRKINYKGVISFEYEKDGEDPLPGLTESVGYVRGVIQTLNTAH